jgi:hypothetical protein
MYATIATFLAAHPVVQGILSMLLLALVGAYFNWVTFKRTPEEWEAYQKAHPRLAMVIRVSRAIFPHLRKIPALAPFLPPAEKSDGAS